MFEPHIFTLNSAVSKGLASVKALKELVVRSQKYEEAAKLNDVEKHLKAVENAIRAFEVLKKFPRLKQGREVLSKELFVCAEANLWRMSAKLTDLFLERKSALNDDFVFNDEDIKQLIDLNLKLTIQENNIIEYLNFFMYAFTLKNLNEHLSNFSRVSVVIRFYTHSDKYVRSDLNANTPYPFYLVKIPAISLIKNSTNFYDTEKVDDIKYNTLFKSLPLKLLDEKICYLFFVLATEGLLAWEDILSIDHIELDFDVKYRYITSN
jgi:hypothetical protein